MKEFLTFLYKLCILGETLNSAKYLCYNITIVIYVLVFEKCILQYIQYLKKELLINHIFIIVSFLI